MAAVGSMISSLSHDINNLLQHAAPQPSGIPIVEVRPDQVSFEIEGSDERADYFIIRYHPVGNDTQVSN